MPVTEQISVEEYLSTVYSPDCDFVDGVLEDRHVGEKGHSRLQRVLIIWFHVHTSGLGVETYPEQRVQVSPSRFRLPDLCVMLGEPEGEIFTTPPFLCVEILAPEDRMGLVLLKVADYLNFGVPYVWVIDPRKRTATVYTANAVIPVSDGILRTQNPDIALPLADLF
jgi:Uma2 family endonuclease